MLLLDTLEYLCSDFWCDSTQKTSTLLYRSVLPWLASAHRELNLPTQQVFLNRTVLFVILQSRFGKHYIRRDLKNSATADAEPETSLPSGSIRKALWQSSAGKLKKHTYILIRIPDFNMMSINFSAKLVTRRKLVRHLSSLRPESNQDFSDTCVGPVKSNEFQYLQQSIVHTSAFQRSLPR